MMLLAVNTSTLQFGLALLEDDGTIVAEYVSSRGKGHFESLLPALTFLCETSRRDVREVEALIVATGPGSFTGLRVGLSAAKGLCHALEAPIIGISSLEALASQIPYSDLPIASILDSRKGEVFTARFRYRDGGNLLRQDKDICLKIEDLPTLFDEPVLIVGNDFRAQGPLIQDVLGPSRAFLAPAPCWTVRASSVGFLGLRRFHSQEFDDPQSLNPVYLRPPDIRPNPHRLTSQRGA
ncbi:MAG: tRNA (adenosine(37)-N6)-threonylcarbamoyltransferase complex dimerization subunit type 1 TsaB [Deltaproteobacteria bacterium]|nr:tRNA (adenosine(37)-N6)-threonylcarbamoyltransferase complex dimerization subunit type 1 TsaB [Deltaproteobacteria bacterium]